MGNQIPVLSGLLYIGLGIATHVGWTGLARSVDRNQTGSHYSAFRQVFKLSNPGCFGFIPRFFELKPTVSPRESRFLVLPLCV